MKGEKKIVVLDYNPEWSVEFKRLKSALLSHIDLPDIVIEHVGSTSIVGLKAKPVLDIDIIINKDGAIMSKVTMKLSELGYNHVGNLGITGREAFKRLNAHTPDVGSQTEWLQHNLYVCTQGSIGLINHLNFRDYLRVHPDKVLEYSHLKQELADKFPYDIDAYIDGKTDFIVDILSQKGMDESVTNLIDRENKLN